MSFHTIKDADPSIIDPDIPMQETGSSPTNDSPDGSSNQPASSRLKLTDSVLAEQECEHSLGGQQKRDRTPRSSRTSLLTVRSKSSLERDQKEKTDPSLIEMQGVMQNQNLMLQELHQRQLGMETTANTLVQQMQLAVDRLNASQKQSEQMTALHTEAIQQITLQNQNAAAQQKKADEMALLHSEAIKQVNYQNHLLAGQSQTTEELIRQHHVMLAEQQEDRKLMAEQMRNAFQEQTSRIGMNTQDNSIMKNHLLQMREENRNRVKLEPAGSTGSRLSDRAESSHQRRELNPKLPAENSPDAPTFGTPTPSNLASNLFTRENLNGQTTADTAGPSNDHAPPTTPLPTHLPHAGVTVPNAMIDNCPAFAPQGYQQWRREAKLWMGAQAGATITQLMSKLIMILPLSVKMDAMTYMEETERTPQSRDMQRIFTLLDERYGKTDTEKSWMWLSQFTEFKRNVSGGETYKDFWSRYYRTITKLKALGIEMNNDMLFHKAIQALRFPDGQLPLVLSSLKTTGEENSLTALKSLTIKMYETHRPITDHTDVYNLTSINEEENQPEEESEQEWEYTDEAGQVFLMKPKKKSKGKNAPGAAESARRGAVANFRQYPNAKGKGKSKGKGKGPCLRCGDPNHWHRDCPLPWREVLYAPTPRKGKSKGKGSEKGILLTGETPPAEETNPDNQPNTEETPLRAESSDVVEEPEGDYYDQFPMDESLDAEAWWSQWYSDYDYPTYVCTTMTTYKTSSQRLNGHLLSDESPLMLLDSGASLSVAGQPWLDWWSKNTQVLKHAESINFKFGDGPPRPSLGTCILQIKLLPNVTNQPKEHILRLKIHVVNENVPLLISRESLAALGATLDFRESTLWVHNQLKIQLTHTPSGHLMLPGARITQDNHRSDSILGNQVYIGSSIDVPRTSISKEELRKIHLHLGHCSQDTITTMLRAAHLHVPSEMITELYKSCKCQIGVHRMTPPNVSSWITKYNGEIIALDVCYPFVEAHPEINGGKSPALIVVDSLSRYINCSLLKRVTGDCILETLLNDWVRTLGKPRKILTDHHGPGFRSKIWTDASDIYGWQLITAPPSTQSQNGLAERAVRSLKVAVRNILSTESRPKIDQMILTQAVIAKNHAPHAITGIPPALAMLGRSDILSGHAQVAFNHDPETNSPMIKQMNSLRNIMNARNAVIHADANHAIRTCINRTTKDRSDIIIPLESTVQIAHKHRWIGAYRVIAKLHSNLILEKAGHVFKWPLFKTRLMPETDEERLDVITIPKKLSRADKWRTRNEPPGKTTINKYKEISSSDEESRKTPIDGKDENGSPEQASSSSNMHSGTYHHSFNFPSFYEGAILSCDNHPLGETLKPTTQWTCLVGRSDPYLIHQYVATVKSRKTTEESPTKHADAWWYEDEIVDQFDPSRIPPRIAFRLEKARDAIEKEITDLLTAHGNAPPAMLEVDITLPQYRSITRVHSTLVVKRKSIGIYKGRLCIRGDTVPITQTAFVSSPTANRCGVKLICIIASQSLWKIHALDISQAFLQAGNLHPSERVILLPPPMVPLPWKKKLHHPEMDLKKVPRHNHGFLLLRPLYGSRDAPMRWFLKLSQVLRAAGLRQLKTDVCFFSYHKNHVLEGLLLAHVDDLLFTGSQSFHEIVISALKGLRTGELETLTTTTPMIFTGLQLEITREGTIMLSQEHYIKELPLMNIESCIVNGVITNANDLRSTFRQGVGALIWTHQTRPDIGFTITQISTTSVEACKNAELARDICRRYNKIVKFMRNHPRKIHYTRYDRLAGTAAIQNLMTWRIIAFSDAGFASLSQNYSVEGNFLILGRVISRDGVVHCHGGMIDHRCAKIHRVCRSSLSAETNAAITAADWSLWFQVFLTEIFTQTFSIRTISPKTEFPLRNPFGESPSDGQLKTEIDLAGKTFLLADMDPSTTDEIIDSGECNLGSQRQLIILNCTRCQQNQSIHVFASNQTTSESQPSEIINRKSEEILFKPMVLTDCCSLFSCVIRLQPSTQERCSRILIAYLRDLQSLITFSFIDGDTNLGDVNTKHAGSLALLAAFFQTGMFDLSFIGRQQSRKIKSRK